jgi:peptide/nickel transport system substrate-binding protein
MKSEQDLARAFLERRLSRRQMLEAASRLGLSLPLLAFLVACGQQAPAAAPTAAPAAPAATDVPAAAAPTAAAAAAGPRQGGVLRMGYAQTVADTLNQHTSNWTLSRMIARHCLDCLVAVDPATGEIKPWLAESWEVSDDVMTYTFKLRDDVTFHDGTPFNAEAVKANFDYTMDPNTKPGFAYNGLGGENYESTTVIDEYTVQVKFKKAYGAFLIYLSDGGLGIDSPTALAAAGVDYGVTTLVGSGPYKFVEWIKGERVVFERNPDYNWAIPISKHQGPAFLDQLIFQDIPEAATRGAALQNGDVQMAQLTEAQASAVDGSPGVEILQVGRAGTTRMYLINAAKAPTDDVRVRQAIIHAVDREALIQLPAWSGIGRPGHAPLPSHMLPNQDTTPFDAYDYPYDPERAIALLEEAGWTVGADGIREKDGQQLILDMVTTETAVPQVEPFDGMLNAIGAKLNIRPGDFNFWIGTVDQGDFHTTLMSDSGFNSVGLVYNFFHSTSAYNDYGLNDPEIDRLLEAAASTVDSDVKWDNLIQAMQLVVQSAIGVMAWEQLFVFGKTEQVQDPAFNEIGFPYLYDVWLTE